MESSSVNGFCRCCASQGAFKDIKTSYHWMGQEEVYSDMLRECFDVNLTSTEQGGICELCISQLRNASNFKKQVLQTETQFKQHLRSKGFKPVKEEMSGFDDNDSDDNDMDNGDDEDYVPDYEVPIKTESESEEKPKKRSSKTPSTRAKKSKSNDDGAVKSVVSTVGDSKLEKEENSKLFRKSRRTKKDVSLITRALKAMSPKNITKRKKKPKDTSQMTEISKLRYNIRMVLQYSNATPIRAHYAGKGFACGFCNEFFLKAADLKTHTISKHYKDRIKYMQTCALAKVIVKFDITGLKCSICKGEFDTVEELMDHLNESHKKNLYTDMKNQIVCFKLSGDVIRCMFCPMEYTTFKPLLEHMNQHYRNFICEVCAAGFVSSGTLARHTTVHTIGEYKCRSCDEVFKTQNKMRYHEKHHSRVICFQCGEKFSSGKLKKDHMKSVHGTNYEFKCPTCDRKFRSTVALWTHKKRDHLQERRFECEHCGLRFFTKLGRDSHMVTHTDVREFLCEICSRTFKLKNSLTSHMRTHSTDKTTR